MFLCSDEECMSLILRHIPSLQYFKLHSEGLENFLLWHRRVQADQLPCASFLGTPWPWGNTAHLFIWVKHYSIQCLAAFCSPQQLWYQDTVDRSVWSPPLGRITSAQFCPPARVREVIMRTGNKREARYILRQNQQNLLKAECGLWGNGIDQEPALASKKKKIRLWEKGIWLGLSGCMR